MTKLPAQKVRRTSSGSVLSWRSTRGFLAVGAVGAVGAVAGGALLPARTPHKAETGTV